MTVVNLVGRHAHGDFLYLARAEIVGRVDMAPFGENLVDDHGPGRLGQAPQFRQRVVRVYIAVGRLNADEHGPFSLDGQIGSDQFIHTSR